MLIHILFSGQVQGIGFRATAKLHASRLHLKGFVRNREDGAVEIFIEGREADIETLIAKLKREFSHSVQHVTQTSLDSFHIF